MGDFPIETRYIRYTFNDTERLDLANKMTTAFANINEKTDELKTTTTAIKAEIAEQEGIVNKCVEKLRTGYEMRPRQCVMTYEGSVVKYIDKENGEVLEEHPMTEDEQLKLTGVRTDAEKIIREASEAE